MSSEMVFTEEFLEDQDLLRKHREGDRRAYGSLFEKHRGYAMQCALRYARTTQQAEDLVHEAFARILAAIARGNGPTISMGHYLVSTIRNLAISGTSFDTHELVSEPSAVARACEEQQFNDHVTTTDWLADALQRLNGRSQQVLWLRAVEHMPSHEIAAQFGVSAATITREYQRAVAELREGFVESSATSVSDPHCREMLPQLRKFAKQRSTPGKQKTSKSLEQHLHDCEHCAAVVSRLRAPERTLLSLLFIAGLGGFATEALTHTPPAVASVWWANWSLPAKIAAVTVPVISAGAVVAAVFSFNGAGSEAITEITLGQPATSTPHTLIEAGDCAVTREPSGTKSEVWRVNTDDAHCDVQIVFTAADPAPEQAGAAASSTAASSTAAKSVTVFDTAGTTGLGAIEITQSGTYELTLTANGTEQHQTVQVSP